MLKSFYVKNFKSWKSGTMIDMTAEPISEHPYNYSFVNNRKEKVLKNLVLYGANASGKSNMLDAMSFVFDKVMEVKTEADWNKSFNRTVQDKLLGNLIKYQGPTCITFAKKHIPSAFEYTFFYKDSEYSYGFEVKDDFIVDEWFFRNNKTIYSRKNGNVSAIKEYDFIIKQVPNNKLYLAYILNFAKIDEEQVLYPVINFFKSMGVIRDFEKLDFILVNESLKNIYLHDKKNLEKLKTMLRVIDFGIQDIGYDRVQNKIFFTHRLSESESFNIYIDNESLGTKKVVYTLIGLFNRLEKGGLIIADEFTSSIHPLLTKLILDMIGNDDINIGNCQIIFSTHDIFFLRKEQFRRDEIGFVYKNQYGESGFNKLYDFKDSDNIRVRNDATYWKNYLKGMYEGTPEIDYELLLNESENFYGKVSKKQKK